jgi:hypothetical protein
MRRFHLGVGNKEISWMECKSLSHNLWHLELDVLWYDNCLTSLSVVMTLLLAEIMAPDVEDLLIQTPQKCLVYSFSKLYWKNVEHETLWLKPIRLSSELNVSTDAVSFLENVLIISMCIESWTGDLRRRNEWDVERDAWYECGWAEALQTVVSECKPGVKVVDLCEKGDALIQE